MMNGHIVEKIHLEPPAPDLSLYLVTYLSEGLKVKGYLLIPTRPGHCPAILYCRGGIGQFGMVQIPRIVPFAQSGAVVFAPFYRGNAGSEGKDEFAGQDRMDVIHAIPVIRSVDKVNPEGPITVVGFSRGAMMALLAARESEDIGRVVVWNGVSDLQLTYDERVDLRKMLKRVVGHPKKNPEAYIDRSPVHWIERVKQPVMIIHGTEDQNVSVIHAHRLADRLHLLQRSYQLHFFEGCGHIFPEKDVERVVYLIFQWMNS